MVTHHRIRYGAGNLSALNRTLKIEVCNPAGQWTNVLYQQEIRPSGAGLDLGWIRGEFDLSAYAGQTVRIRFTEIIPESYTGPAILELDDISLTYVAAEPKSPLSLPAELNWLYELQQMNARNSKRGVATAAAVDALLATYW